MELTVLVAFLGGAGLASAALAIWHVRQSDRIRSEATQSVRDVLERVLTDRAAESERHAESVRNVLDWAKARDAREYVGLLADKKTLAKPDPPPPEPEWWADDPLLKGRQCVDTPTEQVVKVFYADKDGFPCCEDVPYGEIEARIRAASHKSGPVPVESDEPSGQPNDDPPQYVTAGPGIR